MDSAIPAVLDKLRWMREEKLWPNGLRYLWTDAFGVVLLVSLYHELQEEKYLTEAQWVVSEVDRVLGRARGILEAPDRDGQYFHYLAMWLFALDRLGRIKPEYRDKAIDLVRHIHPSFVLPGIGIFWRMKGDLSGPYPGVAFGPLNPFHGYVVYRTLAPEALAAEIAEMKELIDDSYQSLDIDHDLGLGMMLWFTHFFPDEPWAIWHRYRSLASLDKMWIDPPGYFCRIPDLTRVKFASSNYVVSLGLQAVGQWQERVQRLNVFFSTYSAGDYFDMDAINHVTACMSWFPGEFIQRQTGRNTLPEKI